MFILVDDEKRENEGDLVISTSDTNAKNINFMAKYGRGLICLALDSFQAKKLNVALNDKSIIFGTPEREEKKQKIILSQGWPSDLVRELTEEDKVEISREKINLNF